MGPWAGGPEGEVDQLRLSYRSMLAEQAFVVIYAHVPKLELDAPAGVRGPLADNAECRQCKGLDAWRCITVCETKSAHAGVAVGGSKRKRRRTALSLPSEHLLARPQS